MKTIKTGTLPLFILCNIALSACFALPTRLPQKRPQDFTLNYSYQSGRGLYGKKLSINNKTCIYSTRYKNTTNSLSFTLSKEKLDKLYSVLYRNKFDRISQHNRMHYDRNGHTISIYASGNRFRKSNNASRGIDAVSLNNWKNIKLAIVNIINRETLKHTVPITIRLVSHPKKQHLSITLNEKNIYSYHPIYTKNKPQKLIIQTTALPGKHHLFVCLGNCSTYLRKTVNITKNTTFTVSFTNNKIDLKVSH